MPATARATPDAVFSDLAGIVRENVPLAPYTWYRIGGPARWLVTPRSEGELATVLRRCRECGIRVYLLGKGANLLVGDGLLDGAVIRLSEPHWTAVAMRGSRVEAGAGADMARLVVDTCRKGLAGLECMAGIPGTVGGVVRMNAGGRFGDFSTCVTSLRLMSEAGEVADFSREQVSFQYRHTRLPYPYVLSATVELVPSDPDELARRTREIWMYKRNSQPLKAKSAGCVFRNPPPEVSAGRSAGALIDQAGLKGLRIGGACVSDQHANFFTAEPGTRARDVLALMEKVQAEVERRMGVRLEPEVQVWG